MRETALHSQATTSAGQVNIALYFILLKSLLYLTWLGSAWLGSAWLGSAWLGLARLGSAWLGCLVVLKLYSNVLYFVIKFHMP